MGQSCAWASFFCRRVEIIAWCVEDPLATFAWPGITMIELPQIR